jgi:nicotinate-nucleotide adenylyltransferase
MTERAVAGWPGLQVRAVEHTLPAPSYTVETLAALKRNFPRASLYLLLGRDQYADVGRWHRPAALTRLARIVVMNRPGVPRPRPCRLHRRTRVRFLDVIPVDIAAASVRSRLEQGKSVRYLVPAAVEDYIRSRDLYRKPATNRQEE